MYLLTEWESRTGKYLTQNQDVLIESQIFSRPILPNSVNKNFIIWLNIVFFLTERTGIDQFAFLAGLRFSSPIANDMYCTQKDFFICFSYEIAHGAIQVIL